jgi:hypothetical protein
MTLHDVEGLQRVADFDPNYLQLGSAPEEIKRYFDRLERAR